MSDVVGRINSPAKMPMSKFQEPVNVMLHGCAMCAESLSRVRLFVTPWAIACQAPLSMGFSRPEHWSGLPCPPPGDIPNPGI